MALNLIGRYAKRERKFEFQKQKMYKISFKSLTKSKENIERFYYFRSRTYVRFLTIRADDATFPHSNSCLSILFFLSWSTA